jgi:glycosyltransferase involved in cell wall biosynthesis
MISHPDSTSARGDAVAAEPARVTICICTFRRPELLRRLLEAAVKLEAAGRAFTLSCVVVDNDASGSSRPIVEAFQRSSAIPTTFVIEPTRNFALVRNRAVSLATGDYIAFIDDDEVPVPEWLDQLLSTRDRLNADGVLGPVRPYFDTPPPRWIIKGKLCDRPVHPTGMVMPWSKCRSGHVLLKRSIFEQLQFDPAYATGGEDVDFFKRAASAGHTFVWCEEAPAYELVPPERCRKSYFLKRALLQGRISLKYAAEQLTVGARAQIGAKALLALSVYALALPFLAFGGFHLAMRYLIKSCHHLGRFFAVLNVELIRHRNF